MFKRIRIIYSRGLNKVFGSKLCEGCRVGHETLEECKCHDEENSPPSDKN